MRHFSWQLGSFGQMQIGRSLAAPELQNTDFTDLSNIDILVQNKNSFSYENKRQLTIFVTRQIWLNNTNVVGFIHHFFCVQLNVKYICFLYENLTFYSSGDSDAKVVELVFVLFCLIHAAPWAGLATRHEMIQQDNKSKKIDKIQNKISKEIQKKSGRKKIITKKAEIQKTGKN